MKANKLSFLTRDSIRAINASLSHLSNALNKLPVGSDMADAALDSLRYLETELPSTPGESQETRWALVAFILWCGICEDHLSQIET